MKTVKTKSISFKITEQTHNNLLMAIQPYKAGTVFSKLCQEIVNDKTNRKLLQSIMK